MTFFDTADTYGTGHSERVLARALGKRARRTWSWPPSGATSSTRTAACAPAPTTPAYVRRALTASLRRLDTDHVDLYQLHLSDADPERAAQLRDTCEELVREGLIRSYAWSTDDPARAAVFARGPHCAAVQHRLNVLQDARNSSRSARSRTSRASTAARSPWGCSPAGGAPGGRWRPGTSAARRPPGCPASGATAAPTRTGSPGSTPSGTSSPAAAVPSRRAPSPGCGPAARAPSRSPASARSPRPRRTPARSREGRSPPRSWPRPNRVLRTVSGPGPRLLLDVLLGQGASAPLLFRSRRV